MKKGVSRWAEDILGKDVWDSEPGSGQTSQALDDVFG